MPKNHAPYAAEYRRRLVELARAGRPIQQLAREFEPTANRYGNGSSRLRSMRGCAATG